MPRPASIKDIEAAPVEWGTIEVDKIATNPGLLKAFGTFLEAAVKAGAIATHRYGVRLTRPATQSELADQLEQAQSKWDDGQKYYQQMASVGNTEYSWQESTARSWAESEHLPYPPEHDPIAAIDAVIRDSED
jgi:hypothetical protein